MRIRDNQSLKTPADRAVLPDEIENKL